MPRFDLDLNPVTHITTDALGQPGERVFYLQAIQDTRVITLLIEKVQIQSLAVGVEQFLTEITEKFPNLHEASAEYLEDTMHLSLPVEPLFRIGEIGLGYDSDSDLVVLVVKEIGTESEGEEEPSVVRLWCSRSQIRALVHWGIEVANRGRPLCPQCGEPMEPEGHFCPKKNGHKHS